MKVHSKSRAYHIKNRGCELREDISDLEESGKTLRGGFQMIMKSSHDVGNERNYSYENTADKDLRPGSSSLPGPVFDVKWEKHGPEVKVNALLFEPSQQMLSTLRPTA